MLTLFIDVSILDLGQIATLDYVIKIDFLTVINILMKHLLISIKWI